MGLGVMIKRKELKSLFDQMLTIMNNARRCDEKSPENHLDHQFYALLDHFFQILIGYYSDDERLMFYKLIRYIYKFEFEPSRSTFWDRFLDMPRHTRFHDSWKDVTDFVKTFYLVHDMEPDEIMVVIHDPSFVPSFQPYNPVNMNDTLCGRFWIAESKTLRFKTKNEALLYRLSN